MSESQIKEAILAILHSMHDDMLHSLMELEKLLKLFGEDMSWYENWRKEREEKSK